MFFPFLVLLDRQQLLDCEKNVIGTTTLYTLQALSSSDEKRNFQTN